MRRADKGKEVELKGGQHDTASFLSFSEHKPSWHICKLTPKPTCKLLPRFKTKGPKPIKKATVV
jgi:hypothetical protein